MNNISSPRTDDESIEQEIVRKGLTAPRITADDIAANIASEHYFTAADGAFEDTQHSTEANSASPLHLLTFCTLVLKNGFTVTGESACASPENFDAEVGKKIARANAVNKVWPLMGYALREKLANRPADFKGRVRQERAEVAAKLGALTSFMDTAAFEALPLEEQDRLARQSGVMVQYADVLDSRIANFKD